MQLLGDHAKNQSSLQVLGYLRTLGLVTGVVNHTTSIRICLNKDTKLLKGLSIKLWIELEPLHNYGFYVCATLLMFSTIYQTLLATTDNPFEQPLEELATSVPSYLSNGWSLYVTRLKIYPSHLNPR